MIALLIACCGLLLMVAASRCGTALIIVGVALVAVLGWKPALLYVAVPAAAAFILAVLAMERQQRLEREAIHGNAAGE